MPRLWERFYDMETGEFVPEFTNYEEALARICTNFNCEDVARAMIDGISVEQAAAQINAETGEDPIPYDFEDRMNHDHTMNG